SASVKRRRRRRGAMTTRSVGNASGTKTRRPSMSATPLPSCVRSTIVASISSRSEAATGRSPRIEELEQMRPTGLLELRLELTRLGLVAGTIIEPANELKAQVQEIGVQHVRLAVVADRRDLAALPRLPHFRAAHAELAGKAAKLRRELERRASRGLIARQHVHQVEVPPVETVHVVVEPKARLVVAGPPVARRIDAVPHAAIVQHRQVEAAAVPRHELRRRAL